MAVCFSLHRRKLKDRKMDDLLNAKKLPGFPGGSMVNCLQYRRLEFDPWVGKIPWRRKWQPTPVFLPGKFHGQRSLVGYSLWGSDTA